MPMDFFAQLDRGELPTLKYDGVKRARGIKATLFREYLKRFNSKLSAFKPLALVNDMPVYDLTQAPLYSEANQRVLQMGVDYQLLKKPARPISAVIAITHACQCDCRHCSARDYMKSGRRALDYEAMSDLFAQVLDMGAASIVITGGEPTLHPRLLDLVAQVPRDKASVCMFSNGAKMDRVLAGELRSAGLNAALFSIDGPDPDSHDAFRRYPGSYKQSVQAVETMLDAGTLVGVSSYLTHDAVHSGQLDEMYELTRSLGAHQLFLFDAVPTGAMGENNRHHLLTPEDRERVKQRTMQINATPDGPGIMGQSWVNSPEGFGCFAGFYQIYASASGDICPCDFTPISFGNVREDPLSEIWKRMRGSDEWGSRSQHCRMQDACFRSRTVDLFPPDEPLPVRWERVQELRLVAQAAGSSEAHDANSCAGGCL